MTERKATHRTFAIGGVSYSASTLVVKNPSIANLAKRYCKKPNL